MEGRPESSEAIWGVKPDRFAATAREALGERFAGVWLTRSKAEDALINVAIVNPSDGDAALIRNLAGSVPARVVPATYSHQQLADFAAEIRAELEGYSGISAVGVSPEMNRVSVVIDKPSEASHLQKRLEGRVPHDSVQVSVQVLKARTAR